MISFLFLLTFALSSAKPLYDFQRAFQIPCQDIANVGHPVDLFPKSGFCNIDRNVSNHRVWVRSSSAGPALSRMQYTRGSYNSPRTAAKSDPANLYQPTAESAVLEKLTGRKFRRENTIKLVRYQAYDYMYPPLVSAIYLKNFFDSVAWQATNHWPNVRNQQALFTVTQGPFQLTISCLGSTIPWPVLASAARRFSIAANHFYVYTFDAYYMDIGTSMTVFISLRLLQNRFPPIPIAAIQPRPTALKHRDSSTEHASALSKRVPISPISPGLEMAKFRRFTVVYPSALLAVQFEEFYRIIALKIITGQFSAWAPARMRILNLWNFQLVISCDKIDVPWSFIEAFAVDMEDWSSKMFTGFYEATIRGEGALSGLVFLVQMKLRDPPLRT